MYTSSAFADFVSLKDANNNNLLFLLFSQIVDLGVFKASLNFPFKKLSLLGLFLSVILFLLQCANLLRLIFNKDVALL